MDKKVYKIILDDGTVINDLTLNGNNFISKLPIDASVFDGNCHSVTICDGIVEEVHSNMELVQIVHVENGEYWFVLRDISAEELSTMKFQSDMEYIAMMIGIEL